VHAPAICEWSSSGVLFVRRRKRRDIFLPCGSIHGCDNAIRFLKRPSLTVYPLDQWQRMVLFETRGPMAFLDCPRGIRCPGRLACFNACIGLTASVDTSPRIRASQEPMATTRNGFQEGDGLLPETLKLLVVSHVWRRNLPPSPDGQGDRSNLPRQGETRHRRLPPFGEQGFVEIVERSGAAAGF